MSIYIGENTLIFKRDIIAILDRDCISKSKTSEEFINKLKKDSNIKEGNRETKTYIITQDGKDIKLYESTISSTSIEKKFKMKGLKNIDE